MTMLSDTSAPSPITTDCVPTMAEENLKTSTQANYLAHRLLNNLRGIARYTDEPDFDVLYSQASAADKAKLVDYIQECNKDGVARWLDRQREVTNDIGNMSIRQLRDIAKDLAIRSYYTMTKDLLIAEIVHAQKK